MSIPISIKYDGRKNIDEMRKKKSKILTIKGRKYRNRTKTSFNHTENNYSNIPTTFSCTSSTIFQSLAM